MLLLLLLLSLRLSGLSYACEPTKLAIIAMQNACRLFVGGAIRSIILFKNKYENRARAARIMFFPKDIILGLYEFFRFECVRCERDLRPMGKPGHPPPAAGCSCLQISPTFSPHKVLRDSTYCWKIDPDRFSLQPRASST